MHLLHLGSSAEGLLRPALEAMAETGQRIDGYRTEFAYCLKQGISLDEWDEVAHDEPEPRLVFIMPDEAPSEDTAE